MLTKKQIADLQHARQYGVGRLLLLARKDFVARLIRQMGQDGEPGMPPVGGTLLPFIDLEGTRSSEIGRRMGISTQAVGKALKELEDAGLVVRNEDDQDRRSFVVSFTPEGVDYLLKIHNAIDAVEQDYANQIGRKELELLRGLLATVVYSDGVTR